MSPFNNMFSEWNKGVKEQYILQDEDKTSKRDGAMKKLNTLEHYRVPDGSTFSILAKQYTHAYQYGSLGSNRSNSTHRFATGVYQQEVHCE